MGDILKSQNQLQPALEKYKVAVIIREKLATARPENASAQVDLATSYARLAQLNLALRNPSEALRYFKKGQAAIAPVIRTTSEQRWIEYGRTFDADIAALEAKGIR